MQNTIEDLFYGNIHPSEELRPGMAGYRDKGEEGYELLKDQLNEEQRKLFDTILNQSVGDMSYEVAQAFVEGFRLAVRLMTEVYAEQ